MKAAIPNFDSAVRQADTMWDPALPMCESWQGVTCWPDGYVRTISLGIPMLAQPTFAHGPSDNSSFAHTAIPRRLVGDSPLTPPH